MEPAVLGDKTQFPTDEVIYSHIGKAKPLWLSVFAELHANHPEITPEWRYYNDGKRWLLKATHKKKTVFWLSLIEGAFRTTFYFTDKARQAIEASSLSEELKRQFLDAKPPTKIRGITVVFHHKRDIEQFQTLIALKLSMK